MLWVVVILLVLAFDGCTGVDHGFGVMSLCGIWCCAGLYLLLDCGG